MLQQLLPPPEFERWEQLTLQRTLDTMPGGLPGRELSLHDPMSDMLRGVLGTCMKG